MKMITKAISAVAILACLLMFMNAAMAQTDTVHTARRVTYTVEQGDTLYGIAEKMDPHDNPNVVAYVIEQENGINGDLQPGEVIVVPDGR